MQKLLVVIASTRPGRAGLPIGRWFLEQAEKHGKFGLEVADLKEIGLPLLDEPKHPRFGDYQHDHTKAWSAMIRGPTHSPSLHRSTTSPPLLRCLNAIDYLFHEWSYKPAGFVSYGGIAAGTRSVQMTKQILTAVKIMPIPEAVQIPFFSHSWIRMARSAARSRWKNRRRRCSTSSIVGGGASGPPRTGLMVLEGTRPTSRRREYLRHRLRGRRRSPRSRS